MLALLIAGATGGCRQQPAEPGNAAVEPVASPPRIVQANPPLDRSGLLAAVAQAASAAASGAPAPAELRALDGRQFEVRIRFGCSGPSAEDTDDWLAWSYDPASRTVQVRARPTISVKDPLVAGIGGEGFEAAEGFWIPRPWLLQPVCPAAAAVQQAPADESAGSAAKHEREESPPEPTPARQRVGIAQYYTDSDPRTGRRDSRPYQADYVLEEGQALGSQGFDLVLSGRLRSLPSRSAIECLPSDLDRPPDCIVSAEFQRVWIEQPETGEVIADWGGG